MPIVNDQEVQVARIFSRRMLPMNMAHPRHQGKRYLDKTRKKTFQTSLKWEGGGSVIEVE